MSESLEVTVVIGAGGIGQDIARCISSGRYILVANHTQASADAAAKVFEGAGFEVTAIQADISSRAAVQAVVTTAQSLGPIKALIQAAGGRPARRPSTPFSRSTSTAPQWCWKNSARSSPRVARAW